MDDVEWKAFHHKGEVVMTFNKSIERLILNPRTARAMGEYLIKSADTLEKESASAKTSQH